MQLKKIAFAVVLSLLLASPCAASPWTDALADFLDSILDLPLVLAGLSEEEPKEEVPLSPVLPTVDPFGEVLQTDGLNSDDPPTEKGGKIDVDG